MVKILCESNSEIPFKQIFEELFLEIVNKGVKGCRIPDAGYEIPDTRYRIRDAGYEIPDR